MNTSVKMHSTCRLATHELQDDKLSVRKATLTCKKQGFLTLGALRPGLTPPVYPTCCTSKTVVPQAFERYDSMIPKRTAPLRCFGCDVTVLFRENPNGTHLPEGTTHIPRLKNLKKTIPVGYPR